MKRIGTLAYCTHQGLGHLAKAFYDRGVVHKALRLRHPRYRQYPEFYRKEDLFEREQAAAFVDAIDVLLLFENAWWWEIPALARAKGKRIVLVPMYEWSCLPSPVPLDLQISPSLLDMQYDFAPRKQFIPIPAPDLDGDRMYSLRWWQRERASVFVHNAGHGQVGFAKGSPEVLEAWKLVKTGARLIVRGQPGELRIKELWEKTKGYPNVEWRFGDAVESLTLDQLFAEGDVLINAERYNGLSLPLQEARAAGMLVMTTDRFPANTWLPREPLIPVKRCEPFCVNHTRFERAEIDPAAIAAKVDEWYGRDIAAYSRRGKEWALAHSWDELGPRWRKALEEA